MRNRAAELSPSSEGRIEMNGIPVPGQRRESLDVIDRDRSLDRRLKPDVEVLPHQRHGSPSLVGHFLNTIEPQSRRT
jgi:hypothetical protein